MTDAPVRGPLGEQFRPSAKARALGFLWLAGAAVGVLTLALPHDPEVNELANLILAAFATGASLTVLLPGRLRSDAQVHFFVAMSTVVLTIAVHYTGPSQPYLVMYTWPGLYAFFFFPLRAALAHVAFIGLCFGGLLIAEGSMSSPATRWVLAIGSPLVAGVIVSRLIHGMQVQAAVMAETEERRRLTIENAHDAYVAVDRESRIVDWNAAAESLLGWSRRTVIGRSLPDLLLTPEDRAGHAERREALLSVEGPFATSPLTELTFVARDGRHIPTEVRVSMLEVAGQRYMWTFIRDLSERRRREQEELRRASEQAAREEAERSLARERRIAETLQRNLLPDPMPVLPGLDVAARYIPAAADAEVGGDWYDIIRSPSGHVGLVMGDVAGKGLAAAALVGRLRSALRAYALEGHAPGAAIERLNRLLFSEYEDDRPMATLLYAVFDPCSNSLVWASAGHLPPLFLGEDGARLVEGAEGVPLGVMSHAYWEDAHHTLERSETLLLYTDGLVERPGEVIDLGLARLADEARFGGDAAELCDRVIGALVPSGGARDDVAVLAFANPAPSPTFEITLPAEPESLIWVRQLVRRWLRDAGADENELFEVTLASDEACTNVVEHAHAAGGDLRVRGDVRERTVEVVVSDNGAWRAPKKDDQGRGLSIMRALMDEVEVETGPSGSTVTLTRALTAAARVA